MKKDSQFLVYLHSLGFSQKQLLRIFAERQNYREVYENLTHDFLIKENILAKQQENILEKYKKIQTDFIDKKLEKEHIQMYTYFDKEYPKLLREIANPPCLIYIKGELPNQYMLAVVGSRNITDYGKKCIRKIIPDLIGNFCIVSGGAMGCDAEAHHTTLNSGGRTVIVVGTGIDRIYPKINSSLFDKALSQNSCILSIFPLGEPGNSYNFPQRNEIISGLSLGTLVVEAGEKSGTLITAQLSLDQGRELFAIPGELDRKNSLGCNMLLKKGEAQMVTCAQDILGEFSLHTKKQNSEKLLQLSEIQKLVYQLLLKQALYPDAIAQELGISPLLLTTELSLMELRQIVQKNREGKYEIF